MYVDSFTVEEVRIQTQLILSSTSPNADKTSRSVLSWTSRQTSETCRLLLMVRTSHSLLPD